MPVNPNVLTIFGEESHAIPAITIKLADFLDHFAGVELLAVI